MIEARIRELVDEILSTTDSRSLEEQIDDIAELDRGAAMIQAALSVRMAAFAEGRRANDLSSGGSLDTAGRGASFEIAMARRVSKATVDHNLAFAEPLLADFPRLLAACLDGEVSQAAAKYAVKEAEILNSKHRRAIDGELTSLARDLTPGQLRKAAARLVAATDPETDARRARSARARKQVRAIVNGDATGTLVADLPVEQALACWQTLDHEARCRRGDGDERSIRELMCDLFVERLTGQAKATDVNLEIGVVIATTSLLGADDQPAKLVGYRGGDYGALPADIARQLAGSGSAWWRRLVCDPVDGHLVSMDTRQRRFDGTLRKFVVYRDGTSRRPCSDSPIYEIDHIERHADGGPTSAPNGHGLGKADHPVRDLPGWRIGAVHRDAGRGVIWTTPTGHSYRSRPPPILGRGSAARAGPDRSGSCLDLHTRRLRIEYDPRRHRPWRS